MFPIHGCGGSEFLSAGPMVAEEVDLRPRVRKRDGPRVPEWALFLPVNQEIVVGGLAVSEDDLSCLAGVT